MAKIAGYLKKFYHWEYFGLTIIFLTTLIFHAVIINNASSTIFDEYHYVTDGRQIIAGEGSLRTEHPPLGKLFIVWGMQIFGDGPIGWRIFAVTASQVSIILFYFISRRIGLSSRTSVMAVAILAFENLSFVQGGIGMLDVFSVTFGFLALWLYLRGDWPLAGLAVGLSALAKLNGALFILAIGLHWLLTGYKKPVRFIGSMLVAPISFVALFPVFNYFIFHQWRDPVEDIRMMLSGTGALTFTDYPQEIASYPWEWIALPKAITYYSDPRYVGMISPTLWALIIPSIGYIIYKCLKGDNAALLPFSWFTTLYLFWIPATLVTDRVTYVFYFYPAVGSVALALAIGLDDLAELSFSSSAKRRLLGLLPPFFFLLHMIAFIILVPIPLYCSIPLSLLVVCYLFCLYLPPRSEEAGKVPALISEISGSP